MRLTTQQKTIIKRVALELCSADASIFLFGSRLDDNKKGGDIDLLIQVEHEVNRLNFNINSKRGDIYNFQDNEYPS